MASDSEGAALLAPGGATSSEEEEDAEDPEVAAAFRGRSLLRGRGAPSCGAARAALACALAGAALAAAARKLALPLPLPAAAMGSALGLVASASCSDAPNWTNGQASCRVQLMGEDPTLCTPTGWTCKGYEARGLCGQGEPKAFAMGPGLNSPEKHCCACKNFQRKKECNTDTGGTCFLTLHCYGWRGAAHCMSGRCLCRDGYCATAGGTCRLASRSSWMHRSVDSNGTQVAKQPKCSRVTSGTCTLPTSVCAAYRGPTHCEAAQCVCPPGFCTDLAGVCSRSYGAIKARVAPMERLGAAFPGLGGAPLRTALCVSGGGPRSMAAALGQFRALRDLGLLPKVDLISSVSGGSWASSILAFADMDLGALLGPAAAAPGDLSLAVLDTRPPPFGAVLVNRTTDIAFRLKSEYVPLRMLWVETIGKAFLEPFGLFDLEAPMAQSQAAVDRIRRDNPQYASTRFHVPRPGRAKHLVMGGCVEAPDSFVASSKNAVGLQMGPDFTGIPFYPNNGTVTYDATQAGQPPLEHILLGGGLVESFAWGGPEPPTRRGQQGGLAVDLYAPASPFSLAKAVGISSAAFAGFATSILGTGQNLNPQAYIWPVTSDFHPRPQRALPYQLGDGGNIEDTGVLAALQRGATKIAALINSDVGLKTRVNYCAAGPAYEPKGEITNQLAQLFGFLKSSTAYEYLTNNQVFASSEFYPLLCQLAGLKNTGKPLVARRNLIVQANPWWGLRGGYTVDVVFYVLETSYDFVDALPRDTRDALSSGPIGGLERFPLYKTVFQNFPDLTSYTARQINLLSALTEWSIMQNANVFKDLFG